jgi:hypothetical protein
MSSPRVLNPANTSPTRHPLVTHSSPTRHPLVPHSSPARHPLVPDPQPAIYVASLAAVEKIRATEGQAVLDAVDVTCGLSLGEYTALAFAGEPRAAARGAARGGLRAAACPTSPVRGAGPGEAAPRRAPRALVFATWPPRKNPAWGSPQQSGAARPGGSWAAPRRGSTRLADESPVTPGPPRFQKRTTLRNFFQTFPTAFCSGFQARCPSRTG